MRKQVTIVKPQQTAQMGNTFNHPFDPYKNDSKIELHGYFFNRLTKNSTQYLKDRHGLVLTKTPVLLNTHKILSQRRG